MEVLRYKQIPRPVDHSTGGGALATPPSERSLPKFALGGVMARLSVTVAAVCCASLLGISGSFAQDLGGTARPIEHGPIDVAQLTQRANLVVHGFVTTKTTAWIGRSDLHALRRLGPRDVEGCSTNQRRRGGSRWGARECATECARSSGSTERGTARRLCHVAPGRHRHPRPDVRWPRPSSPGQWLRRHGGAAAENPGLWTPSSRKSAHREADDDSPLHCPRRGDRTARFSSPSVC